MARLQRTERTKAVYSLTEKDLRRLSNLLREFGEDRWNVELSDGTVMERIALEQVLEIPNGSVQVVKLVGIATEPKNKQSWSLDIAYTPYVSREVTKAVVEFDISKLALRSFRVEASGEKNVVESFWKQVHDWLRDVKPFYSFMARAGNSLPANLGMYALASVLPFLLLTFVLRNYTLWGGLIPVIFIGYLIIGLGVSSIMEKIYLAVFPIGEFAYGQGEERSRRRKSWRYGLGIGFLLSVISSIVASIFYAALQG